MGIIQPQQLPLRRKQVILCHKSSPDHSLVSWYHPDTHHFTVRVTYHQDILVAVSTVSQPTLYIIVHITSQISSASGQWPLCNVQCTDSQTLSRSSTYCRLYYIRYRNWALVSRMRAVSVCMCMCACVSLHPNTRALCPTMQLHSSFLMSNFILLLPAHTLLCWSLCSQHTYLLLIEPHHTPSLYSYTTKMHHQHIPGFPLPLHGHRHNKCHDVCTSNIKWGQRAVNKLYALPYTLAHNLTLRLY